MKIFKKHVDDYLSRLVKDNVDICESNDLSVEDDKDKNMWAALLDKGYKGSHKYGRFITPKKKTACWELNSNDKRKNSKIENTRVIVESLFGRMKTIWGGGDRADILVPQQALRSIPEDVCCAYQLSHWSVPSAA